MGTFDVVAEFEKLVQDFQAELRELRAERAALLMTMRSISLLDPEKGGVGELARQTLTAMEVARAQKEGTDG